MIFVWAQLCISSLNCSLLPFWEKGWGWGCHGVAQFRVMLGFFPLAPEYSEKRHDSKPWLPYSHWLPRPLYGVYHIQSRPDVGRRQSQRSVFFTTNKVYDIIINCLLSNEFIPTQSQASQKLLIHPCSFSNYPCQTILMKNCKYTWNRGTH